MWKKFEKTENPYQFPNFLLVPFCRMESHIVLDKDNIISKVQNLMFVDKILVQMYQSMMRIINEDSLTGMEYHRTALHRGSLVCRASDMRPEGLKFYASPELKNRMYANTVWCM